MSLAADELRKSIIFQQLPIPHLIWMKEKSLRSEMFLRKGRKRFSVSSLKSMIGEFDGSGGIRACGLALSLYHG